LPGGNTVQTSYTSSAIVTVTDQVNRKLKRETDGLGRLIKVTEQDVATGALTQETTYTYDLADRLIEAPLPVGRSDHVPKADTPLGEPLKPRFVG